MLTAWYVLRIISDTVQIVSCCKDEKTARAQLDMTKEAVEIENFRHEYRIVESTPTASIYDIKKCLK